MNMPRPRPMSFEVRRMKGDALPERWHWFVYDEACSYFVRNGQIAGDRDKAERAARAAITIMGGRPPDGVD